MAIIVNIDVMMAKRKMKLQDLAREIGITQANLSILKTNKARAIRFSTLEDICRVLKCQPGDILEYVEDDTSTRWSYIIIAKKAYALKKISLFCSSA